MGRQAQPLINTFDCLDMNSGIEVMKAEARLLHGNASDPSLSEEESLVTILVSFDPAQADRWSARALAGTYVAAKCSFKQISADQELGDWLQAVVAAPEPTSICAVVFALPDHYSSNIEREVAKFLDDMKAIDCLHLQLTVAIASNAPSWASLGIDGFVAAAPASACGVALQVFELMASQMSPGMVHCVDAEDLKEVLGPAGAPSRLANGVWFPAEGHLCFSAADKSTVQSSAALALLPQGMPSLRSLGDLIRAVRALVAADAEVAAVTPYGLRVDLLAARRFIPIQFLCRPHSG